MIIWVDADACPVAVKEILYRAAVRTGTELVLVANRFLQVPKSPQIRVVTVESGFDRADDEIEQRLGAGDLVITSDIPLAAAVLERGGLALSPRGERFTKDNIGARLNMRDFLDTMRASGIDTGSVAPYDAHDRQQFANQLDRILAARASPVPKPRG